MSKSLSITTIVGRVGTEPDMHTFQSGARKCTLRVAVNRTMKGEDHTDWYTCIFWNKSAEICEQFVRKGQLLSLVGQMQQRQFTDNNGVRKELWELSVQQFVMMDKSQIGSGFNDTRDDYGNQTSRGYGQDKPATYGGRGRNNNRSNDWLDDDNGDGGVPF